MYALLPVGGGDKPVVQKAQEEALHLRGHLGDVVQKQGASVGQLQLPGLFRRAEEQGPGVVPREAAAVYGDERPAEPGGWRCV